MAEPKLPSLFQLHWAESALAVGAVLIAAVSLWVGYDTVRTNHELVAAASWPFLEMSDSDLTLSGAPDLLLSASNAGIGPAKVESVELSWHGQAFRSARQLLRACCALPPGTQAKGPAYETSTLDGTVLRAGQTVNLIRVIHPGEDPTVWDRFHALLYPSEQLSVRICYCSAFNECWLTNGSELNPPRVKTCPVPKVPFTG
jgi:hypothetical protein